MAIYVCGDVHGDHDIAKIRSTKWDVQKSLTKSDYLIVLGDFGLLWSNHIDSSEKYLTREYNNRNFTTLFIDGNHENHWRLDNLPKEDMFGGQVGVVSKSIYHLKRGYVYNIEGKRIFTFGGALSTDKIYRRENVSWWERELQSREEEDFAMDNLRSNNWGVDYVLTHAAPSSIVDKIGYTIRINDPVAKFLEHLKDRVSCKSWHFGHYHVEECIDDKYFCHYNSPPVRLK